MNKNKTPLIHDSLIEPHEWQWQIKNSIRTVEQLTSSIAVTPELLSWLSENFSSNALPFSVTPYFASLMSGDVNCPIFAQVISSNLELVHYDGARRDPLGEEERQKVPHLVHRYPDRVLFLATDRCAAYCRFCTRKRWVGQGPSPKKDQQAEAFAYIEQHSSIREIIFSGGDPLMLSNERINELLERAFSIKHIEVVRFHTRMLSFAPMRVDQALLDIFNRYSPIYLVSHFNHPREMTQASLEAMARLQQHGVALLNQSVLLRGINDQESILKELFLSLVRNKIRPYYLHQCDVINGARHFRVPLSRALSLLENLRGHISGLALPTLVVDIPGGHGKVPIVPNPIVKEDDDFVYLRGFLGGVAAYPKDHA